MTEDLMLDTVLEAIPGVPAGRRIHDIPAEWLERDSESIVEAMDAEMLADADGEYPTRLVSRPSRRYTPANRNKNNVYYVFVHSSEGSYHGAIDWLLNGPVSASYCLIINEAGTEATQLVPSSQIAWAGGTSYSNTYGIHICIAGYAGRGYSSGAMKAIAAWAKYFAKKYEVPVQFAFDISNSTRRQLLKAGLAGHEHIPGADHTDPFGDSQPGHRNNWSATLERMGSVSTPAPIPTPADPGEKTFYRIKVKNALPAGKQLAAYSREDNAKEHQRILKTYGIETEITGKA